jgi:hypothetical protein
MSNDNNLDDPNNIPVLSISEDTEILDDVNDVLSDLAEFGIDQLLKDGVFQAVPLIGSAVGVLKIFIRTKDWLLLRNVYRFRYNIQAISEENRKSFIERLNKDADYRQRVGENLLLLLNRVDDIRKPELIANLFKAFAEGKIDDEKYQKLGIAIDRISIQNIPHLIKFYREYNGENFDILHSRVNEIPDDALQELVNCGLIDIRFNPNLIIDEGFVRSKVVDLGKMFVEIVLNKQK